MPTEFRISNFEFSLNPPPPSGRLHPPSSVFRLPSSVIRHASLSPICYLLSPTTPPSDQLAYLILEVTMYLHLQSHAKVQCFHREP